MARIKYYDQASQEWKYADTAFGIDGRTPVKGEDYFTEEDKQELTERFMDEGVLTYNEQSLTDEQKTQARKNIGIDNISMDKLTENLDANSFRITNLPLPESGSEPATKEFVENFTIEGSTYVATDDGEGNVVIRPYLADEDELVFKDHIQNKENPHNVTAEQIGALLITGGDMVGELNMNGYKIHGLNAPTVDDEAATKGSSESFANKQITDRVILSGGKNLVSINEFKSQHMNTVVKKVSNEAIRVYTTTAGSYCAAGSKPILLKAGVVYTVSAEVKNITSGNIHFGVRRVADNTFAHSAIKFTEPGRKSSNIRLEEDTLCYVSFLVTMADAINGDATLSQPMLEEGSVATEYEPHYKGLVELTNMKLLWENASPTSNFSEQNLSIDVSTFESVLVEFCNTQTTNVILTQSIHVGSMKSGDVRYLPLLMNNFWTESTNGIVVQNCIRNVEFRVNQITIYDAVRIIFHKNHSGANYADTNNAVCIPVRIYGIKGVSV